MNKKMFLSIFIFFMLIICIVFIKKNENDNILKTNNFEKNTFISMMMENDEGKYVESTALKIPTNGYVFNTEKSRCENGGTLNWNSDKNKLEASLLTSDKCYAYFDMKKIAEDLSGNNFNGTLIGAKYAYDDENKMGIYFNGVDDYVDIVDLPASINWDGGFTIEVEAKWLKFNSWSRIFDFGNGEYYDNIFIANSQTTNNFNFDSRYGTEATRGSTTVTNSIVLNAYQKYKVEVIKNSDSYTHNIYKDNNLVLSKTYNVTSYVRNINRVNNYLGKSNWDVDGYFNGYIYNLKITDSNNNPIIWYKFD